MARSKHKLVITGTARRGLDSIVEGEPELNLERFKRLCAMLGGSDYVKQLLRDNDKFALVFPEKEVAPT